MTRTAIAIAIAVATVLAAAPGVADARRARARDDHARPTCDVSKVEAGAAWTLRLCVTARFRKSAFNVPVYLDGLGLRADADGAVAATYDYEVRNALEDGKPAVRIEPRPARGKRRWLVVMRFLERPRAPSVDLTVGDDTVTVNLAAARWRADGEGHVADARVELPLAGPSWVVLHRARLLPLDGPNESLLEVVVENLSGHTVPLTNVVLHARRRGGFSCHHGGPRNPVQTVVLDWPSIVSGGEGGSYTELESGTVAVRTEFEAASCGNYDDVFNAWIPVDVTLAPGAVERLVFQIAETHVEGDHHTNVPNTLRGWPGVFVGLEPGDAVKPATLVLTRPSS